MAVRGRGRGPGLARSTRTGCGTRAADCHARRGRVAGRDRPGAAAPAARSPPRSTRRSTSRRCARWPAHGRERVMTALREALAGYLDLRRGAGVQAGAATPSCWTSSSPTWNSAGAEHGHRRPTRWPGPRCRPAPARAGCAMRMTVVRGFAAYLHTLDPSAEVPPARAAARRDPPGGALPVFRRRHRRAAGPGGAAADAAAPARPSRP